MSPTGRREGRWSTGGLALAACALVLVSEPLQPAAGPRAAAGPGQKPAHLWVLTEPDSVIEYDPATFAARRTLKIPRRLFDHPEYLSVNASGQMIFLPPAGMQWQSSDSASSGNRAWFWDGQRANEWPIELPASGEQDPEAPPLRQTVRQWMLSADGASLFWFENTFEYRHENAAADSGPRSSVRASARVWQTDLHGGQRHEIAALPVSGWCRCETGACSETCPEWEFWGPDGIVDDVFFASRLTPGQLQTTYHESLRYRREGSTWQRSALPRAVERFLCASARGEALITAVLDGGCCGWENEGSDQLLLVEAGKVSVLYDEFARYGNRDYDVSIFPSYARVAPGGSMVAYTLASTAAARDPIRLSSSGTGNAAELARVRSAVTGLPAVEILNLRNPPGPIAVIPRAGLAGWLNDRELLVAREGALVVSDPHGNTRKATNIRLRTASDAFLR
jgi:hypothetical protein